MTPEEQLQSIVDRGALIGYVQSPVVATVGYLELWPEHQALFFNEIGDGPRGRHVLAFTKFTATPDQALFYDRTGLIAVLASCEEWLHREPNLADLIEKVKRWRKDLEKELWMAHCKAIAANLRSKYQAEK